MDSEIILVHVSIPFALHIDCLPACKQILLRLVGQYDLCDHVCVEKKNKLCNSVQEKYTSHLLAYCLICCSGSS